MDYETFVWCFFTADHPDCEPVRRNSIPTVESVLISPILEKRLTPEGFPQADDLCAPLLYNGMSIEDLRSEYDALNSGVKWELCRQFLNDEEWREQEWYIENKSPWENDCIIPHYKLSILADEPYYDQILTLDLLDRSSCILTLLKIDYLGFEFSRNRMAIQTTLQFSLVDFPEIKNSSRYMGSDTLDHFHYLKAEEEDLLKVPTYALFKQHYNYVDALLTNAIQKKELSPVLESGKEYFAPAHFFAWALVNGLTIPEPLQPLLLQFFQKEPSGGTPSVTNSSGGRSRKKRRGAITQKEAAALVGKDEKTIRNWLNGIGTPPNFPGLEDSTAFYCFVERQKNVSHMRQVARAMNRAVTGGDMSNFHQSAEF